MSSTNEENHKLVDEIIGYLLEDHQARLGEADEAMIKVAEKMLEEGEKERLARREKALEERIAFWNHLMSLKSPEKDIGTLLHEQARDFEKTFAKFFPVSEARTFASIVGVQVQVLALIWLRYQLDFVKYGVFEEDLMMTLSFLTLNVPYDVVASMWDLKRTDFMTKMKATIGILHEVLDEVSWEKRPWHRDEVVATEDNMFHNVTFVLDGIECGIAKPSDPVQDAAFYSGKAGKHTIKYETCTHISSGRIMWESGGISGAISDISLTKVSGLLNAIPDGEIGLADKGYRGLPKEKFLVMLSKESTSENERSITTEEEWFNRLCSGLRIEIERVNGRLKRFGILWRYRMRDRFAHKIIFNILCNIVNIQMELQPMRKKMHDLLRHCPHKVPRRARPS